MKNVSATKEEEKQETFETIAQSFADFLVAYLDYVEISKNDTNSHNINR